MSKKSVQIRNSTAEFLIFSLQEAKKSIEVRVEDETIWLTQKLMGTLFDVNVRTISEHLQNIFKTNELSEDSVIRKFRNTAQDGKSYLTKYYSLDAIISFGYRVNSQKATRFRQWATKVIQEYTIKGFALDSERLKKGVYFDIDYFEDLLALIREIRNSERRFYQKITDIYATAMDYNPEDVLTKQFFATVQNKLHFAIHRHTAAELIMERSDSTKPYMGMTSWKYSPTGKILSSDVGIAKNYLNKEEIDALDRIASMYLDYAEDQAKRRIPMTMADWVKKLNAFLKFNERDVLENAGKITAEIAKTFAESEFEKYRIVQDRLFESDFDREVKKVLEQAKGKESR